MSADKLSEIEGVSRVRFLVTFCRTAKSHVKPIVEIKGLTILKGFSTWLSRIKGLRPLIPLLNYYLFNSISLFQDLVKPFKEKIVS